MTSDTVLVVGAGPVGMLLTCELLQRGVDVRLIDDVRRHTAHSRATVVWPRLLELLQHTGITEHLVEEGHRLDGVAYYADGRALGTAWMTKLHDTPYPFAVAIPQSSTEAILEQRVRELGGTIERGVTLTGIGNPGGERVEASLTHADGRTEQAEAGWLVGADGAHSAVRRLLGATFDGQQFEVSYAVTDAEIDGDVPKNLLSYCYSPYGSLAFGPLGTQISRIAVSVPHTDSDAPPSREFFQSVVDQRGPGRNQVGGMRFSATFRVHARSALRFRYGRCLLAGDAAHIMSPASAQGMNTGLQDAVNLGWRLSRTNSGHPVSSSMAMYDPERRSASDAVVQATSLQTRWGLVTGHRTALRNSAIRIADRTGILQRHIAPMVAQTNVEYGPRPPRWSLPALRRTRLSPGSRLPVVPVHETADEAFDNRIVIAGRPWTAVSSTRFTVVMWSGHGRGRADFKGTVTRTRELIGSSAVVVEPAARSTLDGSVLGSDPVAVVVRPDGHLVMTVSLTDVNELVRVVNTAIAAA